LKRGDIILAILPGDYGKARPSVVVQNDRLAKLDSIVLCPCTSELTGLRRLRIAVDPTPENGLKKPTEIMVEKLAAVSRTRCREIIGVLDEERMTILESHLAFILQLS
jgi:mRNA interferase MazF